MHNPKIPSLIGITNFAFLFGRLIPQTDPIVDESKAQEFDHFDEGSPVLGTTLDLGDY